MELLCPICGDILTKQDKSYVCGNRHSFDIARQGHVNLLPVQQKRSLNPGDTAQQVVSRRIFLDGGFYAPIREALCALAKDHGCTGPILDIGCGEGYYSAGLAEKAYEWLFSAASGLLKRIPDILLFLLTSVLSGFMLTAELPRLRKLWKTKLPSLWLQRTETILRRFKTTLGGWFQAQLKLMAVSALVLTIGFLFLQVDYPLLFGMVIALIDALPALGTGLVLIPWALFVYLQGNSFLGTGLLLLYGTTALLRTALEPRLLGKQIGLDPLLTLLALYGGYRLLGLPGMILFPIGAMMIKQFRTDPQGHPAD